MSVPHLGLSVMPVDIFDDHDCVGSIANGILWVEARDDAKHLTKHRTAFLQQRIIQHKVSVVLRLRNPSVNYSRQI